MSLHFHNSTYVTKYRGGEKQNKTDNRSLFKLACVVISQLAQILQNICLYRRDNYAQ